MDEQGDTSFNLNQEQLSMDMTETGETSVLDIPDIVDVITSSRTALQNEQTTDTYVQETHYTPEEDYSYGID